MRSHSLLGNSFTSGLGLERLLGPDAAKSLNNGVVADINVGILLILGISSLGTYGVILGGWASNNKYSLYGRHSCRCPDDQL